MSASLQVLFTIAAAIFGAIIGSFLNALSFRFNTGRNVFKAMSGRSHCMHCGHTLGMLELVPLVSFLLLGARCKHCGSSISWQYPLVEATAALLSVLVYLTAPEPLVYAFWFIVWMLLLFIVVYDTKHTIIPWSLSGILGVVALASLFVSFSSGVHFTQPTLLALLAGPLLALPLFCVSLVSGGRWMGWGDSALELSLGWLLGLTSGLTALMFAFWTGAAVGIALLFASRLSYFGPRFFRYTIKSEVPFAPFLVFGAALAYFLHVDFFSTLSLWY